jgi:transmembrane sensor
VVTIAPASRIAVDFSHHHRDIWLRSGKADFQVRHDASRPFRVHAGASVVQALGTRFSINRLPSGTVVAVTEGAVKVTAAHASALDDGLTAWLKTWLPADVTAIETPGAKVMALEGQRHLVAGESAHISDNGRELTLGHLQHARASSTVRATRLIFHDDTLADIAAEFNRYGDRTIHVEGQAARLQRYSGVFNADDSDSFLEFLTCCSRLQVSRNGSDVTVREPAPRSTSE